MSSLDLFGDATRAWFADAFVAPTEAQEGGWRAIAAGDHTLIHAPTGSGKTLAAFLWAIDRLAAAPVPEERKRCRVLYISPMKALAYDIERNLRAPLTGIRHAADRLGVEPPTLTTAMRTGDTPGRERQQMLRHPPDILITTPESLYLMLTSRAREILASVETVIVDEIHSVAGSKRGSHLALSLERLEHLVERPFQRIGLSATQRPLDVIAEFLAGGTLGADDEWSPRPVTVVDAAADKQLDVEIVVPVADMTRPEETVVDADSEAPGEGGERRSIWPAMYPRLLELVLSHRSTILFVNSRGLAERLAAQLNELAGEELVRSHHGSVSREHRIEIETRLKQGRLRGVVATSTLELGIDMAAVDLVILVESPSSVARGLQRVGRAGHSVGVPSVAKVFPKHRGDLLEAAVVVDRMMHGAIEATRVPAHPLDVLAQHVVAAVATDAWQVDEMYRLARRAGPYRELPRSSFDGVLDMLAGRYPSEEFAELRPRIVWDRVAGTITARRNARLLAITNPGTIPDRGLYTVVLPEGGKVGELDEEMVYESRPGENFVLGSTTWKIDDITHDRVIVTPAPAESAARMPFWHGDSPGRPLELGRAVGAFIREIGGQPPEEALSELEGRYRLDRWAAQNLVDFFAEERDVTGMLPTDRTIVVEQFRDEIGDWRTVLLSPFGGRVHAPWALAARRRYREVHGVEVDVIWSDDGIVFRFPDVDEPPGFDELMVDPDEVDDLVLEEIGDTALFTSRFRESAARALLLPRNRPGSRTPLWLQRRKAASLLGVAKRFGTFPVVLETYREILRDHFDLPALQEVLGDVARRKVRIGTVSLDGPSPFATSLMFDFIASFMYEYDAPVAERRAAALTLDRELLRELIGEPQFRELLDPEVIEQVELELQRLTEERQARSADQVHDLLRWLGPLTPVELTARVADTTSLEGWVETLLADRRAVELRVAGERHLAAIEDVARLRDALGIAPPRGVPEALLEPLPDPIGDVVARYARTHGPFRAGDAAAALRLPPGVVTEVLHRLERERRVASGAFLPGGAGQEWVDAEVLRRLRRRTLAVLRREVEATDPEALARFLPAWHGTGSSSSRPDRLLEVVRRLQGAIVPASILESDVLATRLAYEPGRLDDLLASGDVVWVGRGSLGGSDGRAALYLRDQVPRLLTPIDEEPPSSQEHDAIRRHLSERGASFFRDLYAAAGGGDPEAALAALWDLVWAGEVTNDTMAPLRAYLWGKSRRRSGRRPQPLVATPPAASGRWYLVSDLVTDVPTAEIRASALAEQLLDRHGIVTRDAVLGEGTPGGFAALYPVLAAFEDAGKVRRGYFVEGLGGAQFGLPGAIDRLRSDTEAATVTLAAADPANAYGASLRWPQHEAGGRPARRAGAHVVLHGGALVAYLERGGKTLLTFPTDAVDASDVATAVAQTAATRFRRMTIETIDGVPALDSPLGPALTAAGFVVGYKGLVYRGGVGVGSA